MPINSLTTPLGDQVSRKGALVGGYYDSRTSKLELHNLIQECKRKISDQENESQTLKEQLDDILTLCM